MCSPSNAGNAIPSQSFSLKRTCVVTYLCACDSHNYCVHLFAVHFLEYIIAHHKCKGKSLREPEKL